MDVLKKTYMVGTRNDILDDYVRKYIQQVLLLSVI